MLRVLLYGGCHALVLRDYLHSAFGDRFACTLIVNFELIASGRPFPTASLTDYDAVLFSPIENHAGYGTDALAAACEQRGIPAICFPWLEWHGYFPGVAKGQFRGHFRWHYPRLIERAAAHRGDLADFCDAVLADFPDDALIDEVLHRSTAHIRAVEERNHIAPVLSTAIARDFRDHRLFMVPDHPARRLYLDLLGAVLEHLGIDAAEAEERLALLPPIEPQWRWRMPIFPRVASRLSLAFAGDGPSGEDWIDDDIHPGLTLGLRDFVEQHFIEARAGERTASRPPRDLAGARELMRAW